MSNSKATKPVTEAAGTANSKKKLKTYGARGFMEWEIELRPMAGAESLVRVRFTGGQMTGYGVSPARYSTADPLEQSLIENSGYFKSKRITLLSETEIKEDEKGL